MRLPRDDELHRLRRVRQDPEQPRRVVEQQVGALVGGEPPRESEGEHGGVQPDPDRRYLVRGQAHEGTLLRDALTGVVDEDPTRGGAQRPQLAVGRVRDVALDRRQRLTPALGSARLRPQRVGRRGFPRRRVDAVGDMSHRHLDFRPTRKERLENTTAHLAVQAAHAVHRPAAPDGKIRHVERLIRVVRILPAERKEIAQRDAQLLLGVRPKQALEEGRREAVEARRDRGVRGENIAGAGDRQRHVERTPRVLHEAPRALQYRERRVPLVEVTDLGLEPERSQQSPAPDPQQELLLQPQLRAAAVQLAGDAAERGRIRRVVAVEEIEHDAADLHLPGAEPDLLARQHDRQPQQITALISHRRDGQLVRVVVGVQRFLAAVGGDHLAEVALLIQHPDADHRHPEIAGRLELIGCDVAEATRVNRQRLAEREFHAEVGHPRERRLSVGLLKPGR